MNLINKLNEKDSGGGNDSRKSPYLTRHHSAYNLNNLYSLNMTSTPDLSEVHSTRSTGMKGKRRLRQSTSNGNIGNSSKSLSNFNLSLKMSSKNDTDNISTKKENTNTNLVKVKNVKKDYYNDGIYGSL